MPDDKVEMNQDPGQRAVCSACGFVNPSGFRFCGGCGVPLDRGAEPSTVSAAAEGRPHPERRQLTVMFCDLVGSSLLASRLDPEELRELILSYQGACTSVIRRYDGTVSRYVGDGILALFGYPRAHEDDAERAVRAGLDIISAIAALSGPGAAAAPAPLAARVGIATGLVVVGDLIGEGASEEEAVVGKTPNLAARLQSVAVPNSVVIASGTRLLIGERFDCEDLGAHPLHGFAEPVHAWRVNAARPSGSRFEAAQPLRATSLVGREEHLSWLRGLWSDAERGRGRTALLTGEAGIGKSRLVEALRESIGDDACAAVCFQCSPHYVNTALYPLIHYLERAAGIGSEDALPVKHAKLASWLGAERGAGDAVPLLGALLSIPPDPRYPMPAMSPQRQKERTFEMLLGLLQALSATRPLLVVFEDLHWADPTSQEFLTLLVERVRDLPALVILTFRAEYPAAWAQWPGVEHRELPRLASGHAQGLAERVAGERRLPRTVIEQIADRADGVPLFVEELTRAMLDTAPPGEQQDGGTPSPLLLPVSIPSTLQDSLMARLDQLGPAKLIAQIASTIGREFSYDLLEAVAPLSPARLRDGLRILEQSGLAYVEGGNFASDYAFKHALVQEVAYQSLLRSRRRELHLRIARVLESRFPQSARDAPELVAHHWTEAGDAERAVAAWLAAGRRASERSEYREAIGHLRRGLALNSQVPEERARRDSELALLLALAPALITTEGGGTAEVSALYARSLELCEGTAESPAHFVAHWGWWRASMNHRMGRERADKLLSLSRSLGEPALQLQAHHCQWATLYMLGSHRECCRHIEAGLALYDPERHRSHTVLYGGHDARVCALGERALARWMLGYSQDALEHARAALEWARELRHVGSQAHAMDYALVLHKLRRDAAAVYAQAGELLAYASDQRLRVHRAKGTFFRGWARAMLHDVAGGLGEMQEGIALERDADTPTDFTLYYEMLAEVCGRAGRLEEGLGAVSDALVVAERHGIVFWNAELHRRRGELLLASGDRGAAEASFQEALACAREQEARSLELRAAASLARLRLQNGGSAAARVILRPVYGGFSEGFDTPDLAEVRELLEVLN